MENEKEQQFRKKFGQVIRKHRTEIQISQEKLADTSSLHRTYVSEIERGLKTISIISLLKIANALNIDAWKLLKEVEEECLKKN